MFPLSGFPICCDSGSIAWKSIQQEQTAQSSCKAEIMATDECATTFKGICHVVVDLDMPDTLDTAPIFNNNQVVIDWYVSLANKGVKHINLCKVKVHKLIAAGDVAVSHIPGVINPINIFMKEMKDAIHYRRIWDTFMVSLSNFMQFHQTVPSHATFRSLMYKSWYANLLFF